MKESSAEAKSRPSGFEKILKQTDLVFTFSLFGIILLLVLPVSTRLMDLLLALSIASALLVLLIVVYLRDPSEFTIFPTLLLAVTLYRLGLNVASTRLILLEGYAGNVIDSFGNFVVHGNYVVGAVVFLILVVVNFVVISKGAGRIAEVAARFTLDAMPGKQMAIDAELNSGLIDEAMATKRRMKVQKEADFYGAMDGASKFVRGDAVAGLLITFINVVGGIAIGVLQKDMPLVHALQRYTLLSIGDGLVSQVPALIVSVGAAMLITRTSEEANLGEHFGRQLLFSPKAIRIVASMLFIFSLMPGMPFVPFATLGIFMLLIAHWLNKAGISEDSSGENFSQTLDKKTAEASGKKLDEGQTAKSNGNDLVLNYELITVELGYGLLRLADKASNGDLLERITGIRQKLGQELGFFIPAITIKDNFDLKSNQYRLLLRGKELSLQRLEPSRWLAMSGAEDENLEPIKGIETKEPVFGLKAWWVDEKEKTKAEMNGYTIVDATSVLITHLSEVLKAHAHLLLEREDTQKLIDVVKTKNPTLVNELFPDLVNIGLVQRVLQNLLKEGIGLKNLPLILEAIGDFAPYTKHPDDLSEQARRRLGMYFIEKYIKNGFLTAVILEPKLEQLLVSQVKRTQFEIGLLIEPAMTQILLKQLTPLINNMLEQSIEPIILVTGELRLPLRRFFEPSFSNLIVLSYQELPNDVQIRNYGVVSAQEASIQVTNNESLKKNKAEVKALN